MFLGVVIRENGHSPFVRLFIDLNRYPNCITLFEYIKVRRHGFDDDIIKLILATADVFIPDDYSVWDDIQRNVNRYQHLLKRNISIYQIHALLLAGFDFNDLFIMHPKVIYRAMRKIIKAQGEIKPTEYLREKTIVMDSMGTDYYSKAVRYIDSGISVYEIPYFLENDIDPDVAKSLID